MDEAIVDYKQILEDLSVPILILGKRNEVLFVNHAAQIMTEDECGFLSIAENGEYSVFCKKNGHSKPECAHSSYCDLLAMKKLARSNGVPISQNISLLVKHKGNLEHRLFSITLFTMDNGTAYVFSFNDITEEQQRKHDCHWESMALHLVSEIGYFHVFEWKKSDANDIPQIPYSLWNFCLKESVNSNSSLDSFAKHISFEDQHAFQKAWISVSQNNSIESEVTFRMNRKEGEIRWFQMKLSYLPSAETSNVRGLGIIQDVTRLKNTETQARLMLEKKALSGDHSSIAAWMFDVTEDTLHISPGYAEMLGFEAGSAYDLSKWKGHVHPDDVEKWVRVIEECLPTLRRFQLDYRMRTASGDYLWVSSVGSFSIGDSGEIYIRGFCFNINQYVLQEQALSKKSEYHKALNVFSNMLVLSGNLQIKMNDGLGWIGETTGSVRIFVVEVDKENHCVLTYEWLRSDAFSLYPDPSVDQALFLKLNAMLAHVVEPVVCPNVWDRLETTVLAQAVRSGATYLGFIGMARKKRTDWDGSDRDLLKMLADMISLELEREQTTRALVESEAKYHGLFSKTRDAILLLDGERIFDFNEAAQHLFHCSADWLRFRPFRNMLSETPEMPSMGWNLRTWLESLPEGGYVVVKGASGKLASVAISGTSYEEDNKEWTLLSLHDMSRHLEMEQQLKVNELRLRQIVEGTSDLLWENTTTGEFCYVEGRVQEILGYTPDEMLGKTWFDLMAKDSKEMAQGLLDEAFTKKKPIKAFEKWVVAKNGHLLCMETNAVPMLDNNGCLLGFRGVEKDITARKEAERRTLWEAEINRVSLEVSRMLLEEQIDLQGIASKILSFAAVNFMARGGSICLNRGEQAGWIEYSMEFDNSHLNNNEIHLRAYPDSETLDTVLQNAQVLMQKPCGWFKGHEENHSVFDPSLFAAYSQPIESYVIVPIGLFPDLQGWFMLINRAGGFQESHLPSMKALANLLVIALNRMHLLFSLVESKEMAILANRTKSLFLANMSHEIRTPLNAVLGYAQLLMKESSLGESQREYVNTILLAGKHLLKVINEILEMSRIEAGKVSLRIESFSLKDLMTEVEMIFRQKARSSGLTLKYHFSDSVPDQVLCDQMKVRQVVVNLLSNAVKFTEHGGITVDVDALPTTSLNWSGELESGYSLMPNEGDFSHISIRVADTGKGIAPEEIDKVFVPFEQTNSGMSSQTGTGLGMSISRKNAQQLGGNVTVESQPEVGSTFLFEFNALPASTHAMQEQPKNVDSVGWVLRAEESCLVLVVDDNAWNRDVLSRILRFLGAQVHLVSNGHDALDKLMKHKYDLLMLDLRMPEMNGYDVMDRMMELSIDVPIIVVTASALEEERLKAVQRGAVGFVRKPFQESDIVAAMKTVLGSDHFVETYVSENDWPKPSDEPSSLGLMKLDAVLREQIETAVNEGDSAQLDALILAVEESDPDVAMHFRALVSSFQYDNILRELGCQP